jgi:hypothetical protein
VRLLGLVASMGLITGCVADPKHNVNSIEQNKMHVQDIEQPPSITRQIETK